MPVEGSRVLVISARKPDASGALTIPARIGDEGATLVAFAGVAQIETQHHLIVGKRRIVKQVAITGMSHNHPLANSRAEAHIGYVAAGDIVAHLDDRRSYQQADQRITRLRRRVHYMQRGEETVTWIDIFPAEGARTGLILQRFE